MARAIDKQTVLDLIIEAKRADPETGSFAEWLAEYLVEHLPTLTPPNEWVSVEERLPEPGDLIVYADNTVWGYQYGICRVCGKEKAFDYWILLQDPPNNRPPEGEEDT